MPLVEAPQRYGARAAVLHWVSAGAILIMLPLGFLAAESADPVRTAALLRLHAPLGLLVLGLILARLALWAVDRRPEAPAGQPRWRQDLAKATHVGLYLVILLLCASGLATIALTHASPGIFSSGAVRNDLLKSVPPFAAHVAGAVILCGLLLLHLTATAFHMVRGDHPLARMRIGHAEGGR